MKNLRWSGLHATKFLRGGAPKSRTDLEHLWERGIRAIISLEAGYADALGDYPEEARHWREMGGVHFTIICSNVVPPTMAQVQECINIFDMCRSELKTVYLHCFSGVDRTGWMSAAFLLRKGHYHNAGEAWEWEAWRKGTHKWFFWWKWLFLHRFS